MCERAKVAPEFVERLGKSGVLSQQTGEILHNLFEPGQLLLCVRVISSFGGFRRFAAITRQILPSRLPSSGASFARSRTEKLTTRVTAQRNRSYKYSWPVFVTPQMQYMSKNRAPAAHHIFPKIAPNPSLTDLGDQILSEYRPPASDPTAKRCIISCIAPWLAAMTTLLNPTDLKAAHR